MKIRGIKTKGSCRFDLNWRMTELEGKFAEHRETSIAAYINHQLLCSKQKMDLYLMDQQSQGGLPQHENHGCSLTREVNQTGFCFLVS